MKNIKDLSVRVLILDGGGTQTLPIVEALFRKGFAIHIFYEHKLSYGFGTRYAHKKTQAPSIRNEAEYLEFFRDYVISNKIDVCIPMSDPSAMFLSKNKQYLLGLCNFVAPDYDIFMKGYDKNQLMSVCRENNIPHPITIDLQVTDYAKVEDSFFPAILKPNLTAGGRGMKILNKKGELLSIYESNVKTYGPCHLQEFVPEGGRQFKAQIYMDEEQHIINSSVIHKQRFYPVSGGSSCFNTTVQHDGIISMCVAVLRKIKWIGFADFDLIEDPRNGIIKIMEINPRIPACIKSVEKSGIDYGSHIVNGALGRPIEKYNYIPGKQLRHLGFDILWFIHSKNRFKANPSWFSFLNKHQSFQDISIKDPMPFFYGTLGNIIKMSSSDFRKSKSAGTGIST